MTAKLGRLHARVPVIRYSREQFPHSAVPSMSDPLTKTFDLLAKTSNVHAPDLLIAALDVGSSHVQSLSLGALIRSGSSRGLTEVIRRLEALPLPLREVLRREPKRLEHCLRQCLLHGDERLQRNSLTLVLECDAYAHLPVLLSQLEAPQCPVHDLIAQTLASLVERIYERCRGSQSDPGSLRYAETRQVALGTLCESCMRFAFVTHHAEIVEYTLALGHADNPMMRRVVVESPEACRKLIAKVMLESTHPGVMQLVCDYLSKSFPPVMAIEAFCSRSDPQFIQHLLRWFPSKLLPAQQKMLRQIHEIAWLDPEHHLMASVPDGLHAALARLIQALGLPPGHKEALRTWLVRHGSRAGRDAASSVFNQMNKETVQEIVFNGLDSEDADIQAWATTQLRAQGIPNALQMLVQRLDSGFEEVRFAARQELSGFDLDRLLHLYPHLDPDVCARAGRLLLKVDPEAVAKLRRELASPIRRKRIRAARAIEAMQMQQHVWNDLVLMLHDDDSLVRRTALEILATVPTAETVEAILELLEDPSPRVAETAAAALMKIRQCLPEAESIPGERGR